MAHINHITHWRAGGFTVETMDDEAVLADKTRAHYRRIAGATNAARERAIEAHEAARRDPAVRRSRVVLVHSWGEDEIAAYSQRSA